MGPFSATLAQDGLTEGDQPGKHPWKYSAMAAAGLGWEMNPVLGEDSELSTLGPWSGQAVRYIHSSTELS